MQVNHVPMGEHAEISTAPGSTSACVPLDTQERTVTEVSCRISRDI